VSTFHFQENSGETSMSASQSNMEVMSNKFHELPLHERPLAVAGLVSYRAESRYGGWIMIGARDDADAWREAKRSTPEPKNLQRWDGTKYVKGSQ